MSDSKIDLAEDIGAGIGDVAPVVEQARRLIRLEREIEALNAQVKLKQEEYDKLSMDELPALMDSVGIEGLPLANGYRLELRPVFRASLPARSTIEKATDEERVALLERFNDGLKWLRAQKASDLIKTTLKINLGGKGQEATARVFLALAARHHVTVDRAQTVHPGSLGKFLKEKLSAGVNVPLETFNVLDIRKAEIKSPNRA
jgi:hypothetical protein